MKTENQLTRGLNIVTRAVKEYGLQLNGYDTIDDIVATATELLEDSGDIDYEAEADSIDNLGYEGFHIEWADGKGYTWWAQGEFSWAREYCDAAPGTRIDIENVVDTDGKIVRIYIRK